MSKQSQIEKSKEGAPVKKYDALKPKAKDEKKWEYALADANVRCGPGTQYQIVSKLEIFDQVVIVGEESSGWDKIELPATGYVYSSLTGTEQEAKLKYVERFERDINDMHRKGIILSADRGHFCVNRDKWNKVEPDKRESTILRYAGTLQIKWNTIDVTVRGLSYSEFDDIEFVRYNAQETIFPGEK
jgi:uncharacterized protein YgiM (DUF1202 family)